MAIETSINKKYKIVSILIAFPVENEKDLMEAILDNEGIVLEVDSVKSKKIKDLEALMNS